MRWLYNAGMSLYQILALLLPFLKDKKAVAKVVGSGSSVIVLFVLGIWFVMGEVEAKHQVAMTQIEKNRKTLEENGKTLQQFNQVQTEAILTLKHMSEQMREIKESVKITEERVYKLNRRRGG